MYYEWDEEKAEQNLLKHGVAFQEAFTVFKDPKYKEIYDPEHSEDEDRYIIRGISKKGRLLVVSYTERGNNIRLISARKATKEEIKGYEEN